MTAARNALSIFCALCWCLLVWSIFHNRAASLAVFIVCALLSWLTIAICQSARKEGT